MIRTLVNNDIVTIILCSCLVLIAVTRFTQTKRLHAYFGLLFSSKYLTSYGKDIKLFDNFNVLFYGVFIMSLTVLLHAYIDLSPFSFDLVISYLVVFAGLFLFFGVKFLVSIVLSKIFNMEAFIRLYLFKKISYRHYMSFFLIPVLAIFTYHDIYDLDVATNVLIFLLFVHIINYCFIVKSFFDSVKQNIFYFILYLCILEIVPYVVLYKSFI